MSSLKNIAIPVKQQMQDFEKLLRQTVSSQHPILKQVCGHLLSLEGKRCRPLLTLLVGQLHGTIDQKIITGALIMELTHNASLVHDDVLDEAYTRRGRATLNALLRSKGAVLVGDFLMSKGVSVGVENNCIEAISYAAHTMELLVEGELRQAQHAQLLDIDRDEYFSVITLKTANLMAASAAVGAIYAQPMQQENMHRLGMVLGMAFQVKDDMLDFAVSTGKLRGNDLRERKITLPLIFALEQHARMRPEVLSHMRQALRHESSVEWLVDFVLSSDAMMHCDITMHEFHNEALEILNQYPHSPTREALIEFADFVCQREY
ncbi:MAG: polyprenyl synthetase family protein [Mucinivorans sp.]